MIDVRRLRVLSEVAARGSYSAAAQALRLTQSAVSQHIAALEREVGLPLVERGTRPVELTDAGHALTRHATGIFARLEGAEQELGEIARRRRARLRLGSVPTALATFVPAAFRRFRRRHGDVTLTVVDDPLQRLLPRLEADTLDLALIYEHPALPEVAALDLHRTPLLEDAYQVALPPRPPARPSPAPSRARRSRGRGVDRRLADQRVVPHRHAPLPRGGVHPAVELRHRRQRRGAGAGRRGPRPRGDPGARARASAPGRRGPPARRGRTDAPHRGRPAARRVREPGGRRDARLPV